MAFKDSLISTDFTAEFFGKNGKKEKSVFLRVKIAKNSGKKLGKNKISSVINDVKDISRLFLKNVLVMRLLHRWIPLLIKNL